MKSQKHRLYKYFFFLIVIRSNQNKWGNSKSPRNVLSLNDCLIPLGTKIHVNKGRKYFSSNCDVLLTVHLSIFISVFNQRYAQNLFHNKFYFMPLHVSSTCAHHQEVKIALHSLWYHHTHTCDETRGCVMQFWPPDDEHMCSKHVEAWNKTYCEINFVHKVG